ncbi:hypothetical protein [Kiloniella sp.]|uniref:hypothetical protein n=1 Tax=Kiloniella sp. TaxID=1938587 RepID=UPI003B02C0F9
MNQTDKFDLDDLLTRLKKAAITPDAPKAVRVILEQTVSNPEAVACGMPAFAEDEAILFEDETISVWFCRFQPGNSVPPHDHQMSATIGVYLGAERNDFYENDPTNASQGSIRKSGKAELTPGEVLSIGPSAIHSVTCISEEPCCGIHVYLGKLTTVDRSLFNTETNETLEFTDENYHKLQGLNG